VQTKYRYERRVTAQLQGKGLETFLPLLQEIHRWSDRPKQINVPLFSGYTFARLTPSSDTRAELLRTGGVIGLICFGGEAVPVSAKQIHDLRTLLAGKVPCALHAFLKAGQRVRVRGGCLDGLEGLLEETRKKELVISIESIQRSVAVRIEGYELELV
jgi:transcription antitermination factor NusG